MAGLRQASRHSAKPARAGKLPGQRVALGDQGVAGGPANHDIACPFLGLADHQQAGFLGRQCCPEPALCRAINPRGSEPALLYSQDH